MVSQYHYTSLKLPPHHLIHHPHITLNDPHHLAAHILLHIIWHRDPRKAVEDEIYGCVNALKEPLSIDAAEHEAAFVEGFGALGRGSDTHRREWLADAGEVAALLRERAAVGDYGEGVHLQAIVVVEAERLVLDDTLVELESAGLQALAAARVATVKDGHIVFLCHLVDGREEAEEVFLGINVLFAVGGEEDVLPLLQTEAGVDVAGLDGGEVLVQDFGHRAAGNEGTFFGETAFGEVSPSVFAVG